MNILFMGSGPFGLPCLDRLHQLRGDDLQVATVPDAPKGRKKTPIPTPIKARAAELGIACHEVATLRKEHGPRLHDATRCELVIVADFRLILTRRFLETPPRGCFNLHGSLLPRHRGAAPIARGVLAGDDVFGVTLYRMVRELDAGPVVARAELAAESDAPLRHLGADELESRISRLAADLLEEWLPQLESGDLSLEPQDDGAATLAPKLAKEEGWIPWHDDAEAIRNRILALRPWPRCFAEWCRATGGSPVLLFIDEAVPAEASAEELPVGTVRSVADDGIVVACGDGKQSLRILRLQRAGKKSLTAAEFLRGQALAPGDVLAARGAGSGAGDSGVRAGSAARESSS